MKHYSYLEKLETIWQNGVAAYRGGQRGAEGLFSGDEIAFLQSIGQSGQEFFDYAEDFVAAGEPGFATVAAVADIRRAYFLEVQGGQSSGQVLDPDSLPAKDSSVEGISWLPRILPKARAKLRGELDPDIMYGCGGDRRFFKENDIHPAELLRIVWQHEHNDEAVIAWVLARRKSLSV